MPSYEELSVGKKNSRLLGTRRVAVWYMQSKVPAYSLYSWKQALLWRVVKTHSFRANGNALRL